MEDVVRMRAEAETFEAAQTLLAVLDGGAPDGPALIAAESGETISFAALGERVATLACSLRTLGVRRGDRVSLALPSGIGFVETIFAILTLGAAAAPLNPAYTKNEFEFYLGDIEPRLLLLPADELAAARLAAEGVGVATIGDVSFAGAKPVEIRGTGAADPVDAEAKPDDIALLLHTSGTTSKPKQVPLLHRNLMSSVRSIARHYELDEDDVSFCAMPLFHVHGLVASVWASLAVGGSVVLPDRLSGKVFWKAVDLQRVSWFSASPTIHQMLIASAPDRDSRRGRRPALRFVRSCSAALSPAQHAEMEQFFDVPVLEAYGMTEASHQIASNPLPPARRMPGSVGLATGVEVRVVAKNGKDVKSGMPGQILIKGSSITPGYLNDPAANAEAFSEGWFKTGDLGYLDGEGYVYLSGRIKELIIRGGENIAPGEVEDVLMRHPKVTDAVCFGVPDVKYGEVVAAAVVVSGEVTDRALKSHCRLELTSFKVPATIYILEVLPRTPTGKIQRRRMPAFLQENGY